MKIIHVIYAITVFIIAANIFILGMRIGLDRGYTRATEIHQQAECEVEYSYKPYNEIPARCLKYFELK